MNRSRWVPGIVAILFCMCGSAIVASAATATEDLALIATGPGATGRPLVAYATPALRRTDGRVGLPAGTALRVYAKSENQTTRVSEDDVDLIIDMDAVGRSGLRAVLFADKALMKKRPAAHVISVGWVDLSKAWASHPLRPEIKQKLDVAATRATEQLSGMVVKIQKLRDDLNAVDAKLANAGLPDPEKSALEKQEKEVLDNIERSNAEMNSFRENVVRALRARTAATEGLLAEDVYIAASVVAKARKLDLVLDSGSVGPDGQAFVTVGAGGQVLDDAVMKAIADDVKKRMK